jgi:hypothetical protein
VDKMEKDLTALNYLQTITTNDYTWLYNPNEINGPTWTISDYYYAMTSPKIEILKIKDGVLFYYTDTNNFTNYAIYKDNQKEKIEFKAASNLIELLKDLELLG